MNDYQALFKKYINVLAHEGGSDLHFSTGAHPTIRVAGSLTPMLKEDILTPDDTRGFLKALISPEQEKKFLERQEIDFAFESADNLRFRGNAFFQRGAVGIALRLIPKKIATLQELNLPDTLFSFARKSQGFFLVVGPVGQGKTTTLASMVELINTERMEHIITIEDPIEYIFEPKQSLIDQREVGIDTKDFASALLSAFREDVDVLLVGEMRGPETMAAAVTAAETGHLVFSTLHTNNAAQTIDRIIACSLPHLSREYSRSASFPAYRAASSPPASFSSTIKRSQTLFERSEATRSTPSLRRGPPRA